MWEVEKSFSKQAVFYDEYADVQKKGAVWLASELEKTHFEQGFKNILEIGCGTGLFSEYLVDIFTDSRLFLSDISLSMVEICRKKLNQKGSSPYFFVQDGQSIIKDASFDIIVSSFTLQWFDNYLKSIENFIRSLKNKGSLFILFQGPESFPEWKAVCGELSIPFSGNPMPDPLMIKEILKKNKVEFELTRKDFTISYPSSMDFFRSLKNIGASVKKSDSKITSKDLFKIVKYWDSKGDVKITYSTWLIKVFKK